MEYCKPRMDAKQREARRVEAVRRLRAGQAASVVAAELGLARDTVYTLGKVVSVKLRTLGKGISTGRSIPRCRGRARRARPRQRGGFGQAAAACGASIIVAARAVSISRNLLMSRYLRVPHLVPATCRRRAATSIRVL